eukprot:TRINITY_DN632_c0_g1_i1.p1 TRINITY_DN632_c0_g1~~TRINITY_DN632_c0_g1_i1.p1  ORF type:complete len:128 (-),score=8.08 TRINITY_DN632_c0_g1_i1:96-479(-)
MLSNPSTAHNTPVHKAQAMLKGHDPTYLLDLEGRGVLRDILVKSLGQPTGTNTPIDSNLLMQSMAEEAQKGLRALGIPKCRFVVQVLLGDPRTQSIPNFWNSNTCIWETYTSENIFGLVAAFPIQFS